MIEQDTRYIIDSNLVNKGWILDISNPNKNVFFESDILRIIDNKYLKKSKKKPDYVLVDNQKKPIAVIEAKSGGKDLEKALIQATEYAEMLEAPLIFAMNNSYCQTKHLLTGNPLFINENEVNELIRQKEALMFLNEGKNEIYTIPKEVIISRRQLITIFKNLNNTLRAEGLRAGIERLSEFANILFLKLYAESGDDNIWNNLKRCDNDLLITTFSNSLKLIDNKYGSGIFTDPQIKNPETLKEIIYKLDKLKLSAIDADIKGDAFEYFLQQATATNNDLGEYFTPRHVVRTIVNLANPKFKESVYDPFCGTGGFLTEAFVHIKTNTIIKEESEAKFLKGETIFGTELTTNARLAKMNMILHGDGHSGVKQDNSLLNPVDNKFDVVLTNIPFSQTITSKSWNEEKQKEENKNQISPLYYNGLAKNDGDGACILHCFKAVKKGGRMALVVPDGILFKEPLEQVRKFLLENSTLKSIVSLPVGVFMPYAVAKCSILYFTDCHNSKTKNDIWFFEVKSDGFTLDNKRKKIKDNDLKKIEYLDFNRNLELESLKDLGFYKISIDELKRNHYNLIGSIYKKQENSNAFDFVELGDICFEEKNIAAEDWQKYDVCTISSLKGGIVKQEEYFKKSVASSDREKYKIIKPNEFGYRPPGLDIGTIGYNKFENPVIVSPIYVVFSYDKKRVNKDFLLKIFHGENFKNIVKPLMIGTARPAVAFKQFKKIKIPLPSIEIQNQMIKEQEIIETKKREIKKMENNLQQEIENVWTSQKEPTANKDIFDKLINKASKPLK